MTYKKVYENGVLTNPITKDNPFISGISQRPFKRKKRFLIESFISKMNPTEKPKYDTYRISARGRQIKIS